MASSKQTKVKVSERALLARVNRVLVKEGEKVLICRTDSRWFNDLGRYYSVNLNRNSIEAQGFDLEQWGRVLGLLKAYEILDT